MKKLLIFMFFVLFILFSGFVLAEGPPGVSDVGVEYDSELDGQFLLNEWVHVTVDVKDFSNVTINYKEDSVEVQAMKDNLRWDVYRNTSEAVLSTLSEDEFQIWRKSEWGTFFSGNITREGFDKLLNDKRVRKIYAKKEFYTFSIKKINNLLVYLVPFILLSLLIILLLKLKKRKWEKKR